MRDDPELIEHFRGVAEVCLRERHPAAELREHARGIGDRVRS
jgi:hypothetical protein